MLKKPVVDEKSTLEEPCSQRFFMGKSIKLLFG
jgi:hypothetical protein